MAANDSKKYWYIKLPKEFFNRHDIKILESQPNGKDYCLFYLKLLLESVSHNGELRFSETIPYDENMLSVVTNTNVDVVRSATKVLIQLGLIEVWDDKTIYLTEINKMLDCETGMALRSKEYRERKKLELGSNEPKTNPIRTESHSKSHSKESESYIESESNLKFKEKNNKKEKNELDIDFIKSHLENDVEIEDEDEIIYATLTQVKEYIENNGLYKLYPMEEYIYINDNKIENWQDYLSNKASDIETPTYKNILGFVNENNLKIQPLEAMKEIQRKEIKNWEEYLLNETC